MLKVSRDSLKNILMFLLMGFSCNFLGNLNIAVCGAIMGWTSPILPKLSEENPIAPDNPLGYSITKEEGSWIGSLLSLGVIFGCLVSGYLGEWLGRKRALLMSTFPFLVGWILLSTATNIIQIYTARFILGLSVAVPYTIVPMYTGEIAEVSVRGTLGSFLQLFATFGFVFSYSVGPYVPYKVFCLLSAGLNVISFISFMFMPESPYFLLSKGRKVEASEALARLRGKSITNIQKEIEELQVEIDEAYKIEASWNDIFKVKANLKSTLLMCTVMCFLELMGIDVVLFYVEDIFRDAGTKNTSISSIIFGVFQVLASTVTPIVADRCGRKILLVISSIGTGTTVGVLGGYFYLKKINYDMESINWIPLPALAVYIIFFSIGWGSIPWAIMGEIFAPSIKHKASSISVFTLWAFSFLLTKFFTNIEQAFGAYTGFWFFSMSCAVNILFVLLLMPETKGKTLREIQDELSGKKTSAKKELVYIESPQL